MINQPLGNRGDESAHKGLVRALLKVNKKITIKVLFCNERKSNIDQFVVVDERVKYINIRPFKGYGKFFDPIVKNGNYFLWYFHPTTLKLMRYFRNCDLVLNAPGGICMGGFQFWEHLFYLKMAQYLKKRIVYYGRSFGPFPTKTESNRLFKKVSVDLLNYFSFISIRDNKTEEIAKELNLKYVKTVDSAFLDNPIVDIPDDISNKLGRNYVVFVPNSLIWHYAFKKIDINTIIDFYLYVMEILRKQFPGYKIVMLPQLYGGLNQDYIFFKEIEKRDGQNDIVVMSDTFSSDVQQMIIRGSSFLVGARYHSVVFAINQEVPFIALNYEHKIMGLLKTLDLMDNMIEISNIFENPSLIEHAKDLLSFKIQSSKNKNVSNITAKDIAQNAFDLFTKSFLVANNHGDN